MNRTTIWQRMGTLLLALVLVVGMLPVSAMAEEGWNTGADHRFSVELRRLDSDVNGYNYKYEVHYVTNNVNVSDADYYWCDSLESKKGQTNDDDIYDEYKVIDAENNTYTFNTTHSIHYSNNADVGLKVKMSGLWVKVTIDPNTVPTVENAGTAEEVSYYSQIGTWATQTTMPSSVEVGVPFALNHTYVCAEAQRTGNDGKYVFCGIEDGTNVSFNDSFSGATVQKQADGKYIATEKSADTLTLNRVVSTNGTSRGTEIRTASVTETAITDVQIAGKAANPGKTFVTSDTVTLSIKCDVQDAAYLPAGMSWTKGENGIWTAQVGAGTYTIGGKDYIIVVDNVTPDFVGTPKAYVDGNDTDGYKTYVSFELNPVPPSGIEYVSLGGGANEAKWDETENLWVVEGDLSGTKNLVVKSNVGAFAVQTIEVISPLTVTVEPNGVVYSGNFTNTTEVKVTTSYAGELEVSVTAGGTFSSTFESTKILKSDTLNYVDHFSNKQWSFTDELGRVVTGKFGAYTVDKDAPAISVKEGETELTELSGYRTTETVTIDVTITDAGSGVNTANSKVLYYLSDGAEKTATLTDGKATITLNNGDVLNKITVIAEDNLGNKAEDVNITGTLTVDATAPDVKLTLSAKTDGVDNEIKGFYNKDGKNWLVLGTPVESDAEGINTVFTATMTVSDTNLPEMTGWTKNEETGKWEKDYTVATVANHNELEVTVSIPVLKDKAGLAPNELDLLVGNDQTGTEQVIKLTSDGTNYTAKMAVDRRYPGGTNAGVPVVTFTPDKTAKATLENDVKLYNDEPMTFAIDVEDNGSGLKDQTITVALNSSEIVEITDSTPAKVELTKAGEGENNELILRLTVKDNVGNNWTYQHTFAFDNQAPRMEIELDPDPVQNGTNFYANKPVKATVTVEELNYTGATLTIDGTATPATEKTYEHTFDGEGTHSISVVATDLAGNAADAVEAQTFILDTKAPTVQISQTTEDTDGKKSADTTHYFNGKTNYVITVADANLTAADNGSIVISYQLNGTGMNIGLADMTEVEAGKSYKHEIALVDGDILGSLSIVATDNAGNSNTAVENVNTALTFTGTASTDTVVVDLTPPAVTISKDIEKVNTVDGVDLYSQPVTYTIEVVDTNLDTASEAALHSYQYTYTGADGANNTVTSDTGYQWSFTIEDTQRFTGATLTIADAAGNKPIVAGSTQWKIEDGVISYNSNNVVVDTTVPTAELSFECLTDGVELQNYYTNNGVAYLKLSQPTTNNNRNPVNEVQVRATLTVADNNLSTKAAVTNTLANADQAGGWTLTDTNYTAINDQTGVVTFTRLLTVKTNATAAVELDFQIQDLVDNKLADVTVAAIEVPEDPSEQIELPEDFMKVESGKLTGTITLDRRQPTTGNPDVPEIKLNSPAPVATLDGGIPLYNASQSFGLAVNDGSVEKENAGLKSVAWKVLADAFITGVDTVKTYDSHTLSMNENILVTVAEAGEQNDVQLSVNAEDNVGNAITYGKTIAVDTLAPRVVVTCDNNVQPNVETYFNKDRVATITVTDINFDPTTTVITAKGGAISEWTHNGSVHTATVSYTKDGECSLSMVVKDKAGNTTNDAAVDYKGMDCHDKFTIDKTLPVIHVHYNPADESGLHNGVLFYNKEQHVTVTIEELNFRAQDVYAEFKQGGVPSAHALSNFDSEGINHRAYVAFGEGNNYNFTVDFKDMAGNIAVAYKSPSFSVDLHAPEIEILNANVSQDYVQPLDEDLELVLQVTDEQRNLSTCRLILTHLNNSFEQTEVSGDIYYTRENSAEEGYRAIFTFKDFPYEKLYDGIYTVELYAEDHAGNEVKLDPPIQFSMNRFGSTFFYGDEFTEEYLTDEKNGVVYHNTIEDDLVIKELNPNKVYTDANKTAEGSSLTMVVNGQSTLLVRDRDYKLTVEEFGEEGSSWYVYTYEIKREIFEDGKDLVNGKYSIVLYGVDEAGNSNTNTLETVVGDEVYTAKIEFVLDTIAPVIITTGIESGEIYDAANKQMEIEIVDSTPTAIQLYLNGQLISLSEEDAPLPEDSVWLVQDEITGIYTLNVTEQTALFSAQDVKIQALDAANNPAEEEVTEFTITTNWFVRFINSGWLLILLAVLAAVIVLIIVVGKKKKKAAV